MCNLVNVYKIVTRLQPRNTIFLQIFPEHHVINLSFVIIIKYFLSSNIYCTFKRVIVVYLKVNISL